MKYKISKEKFNEVSKKLIKYFFGDLFFFYDGVKTKDFKTAYGIHKRAAGKVDYLEVHNHTGNIIDIWFDKSHRGKKCKTRTTIHVDELIDIESFMPIMRKKEFAKVLSDYFQEQLNFKSDCIDFYHSHIEKFDDEGEPESYEFKTYKYNPNKKKKR